MIGGLGGADKTPLHAAAIQSIGLQNGILDDSALRTDIARWSINKAGFDLTMKRAMGEAKAGQSLGAFSSFLKYYGTELNKSRLELLMAVGGFEGLEWEGDNSKEGLLARTFLRTKGNSIEGGTSEVQLNIVAKRILGLPSR